MTRKRTPFATLAVLVLVSCVDGVAPVVPEPASVTFVASSVALTYVGETHVLEAVVRDQMGDPISGAATWTSMNEGVVTVSAVGLLTAVANGTTSVAMTLGGASGSLDVEVRQRVSTLGLSLDEWSFSALNDTLRLAATPLDEGSVPIDVVVIEWASLDTTVATVTANGIVSAHANGVSMITAIADGVVATARITVDQMPGDVVVSADSVHFVALGDTATLSATVLDSGGSVFPDAIVTWTSADPAVVSVDEAGTVTTVSNGATTLTATSGLIVHTATVTVAQVVTSVVADTDSVALPDPGDQITLIVSVTDALGAAASEAIVVWASTDQGVALVDSAGLVTGVAMGSADIIATAEGFSDTIFVSVEPELDILSLVTDPLTATVVSEVSLSARVEDLLGASYAGATVFWGVAANSGSITSEAVSESDETGAVGAVWQLGSTSGPQIAFATIQTRGAPVSVEFLATAVAGVAVSASIAADTIMLSAAGETAFLAPAFVDAFGNATAAATVDWVSTDPSTATVAPDGLISGVGEGTTWIRGSLGSPFDSIEVTVGFRGAITITFDDGWLDVHTNAWPILQTMGIRANVGVYTEAVDGLWPAYMHKVHLDELHAAGWSMVSHTVSHDSLPTLDPITLDYELRVSQQWLIDAGYNGGNIFIAPYHEYEERERIAAAGYYTASRGQDVDASVPDSLAGWMPSYPYELVGVPAENLPYDTVSGRDRLRDMLQFVVDNGLFVDLFFHQVPVAQDFQDVMDVVNEFRDRVVPYHELYPLFARTVF